MTAPAWTSPALAALAPAQGVARADNPLRVLVCDDSVVIRAAIARMLEADPALQVVARARNGDEAIAAVKRGGIDVGVIDIEMPVMDGLTALPLMLQADPGLRMIVCSTLTTKGGRAAMEAMRRGAADCIAKPLAGEEPDFARTLVALVRGHGELRRRESATPPLTMRSGPAPMAVPAAAARQDIVLRPKRAAAMPLAVLAIGASTGGPEALATVFRAFRRPPAMPVLLTQHMPGPFIPILADHLAKLGGAPVAVAQEGEPLRPGRVYLAAGGRHLQVVAGSPPTLRLWDGPEEHHCRPAVDPMLRSLAEVFGGRAAAAVLTGMGYDGGAGALEVAKAGGLVLAQDAATSVVWGMPGAVVDRGAAHEVLPLKDLALRLATLAGAA
jgi:two-component system chemotaxis response regulator CheB